MLSLFFGLFTRPIQENKEIISATADTSRGRYLPGKAKLTASNCFRCVIFTSKTRRLYPFNLNFDFINQHQSPWGLKNFPFDLVRVDFVPYLCTIVEVTRSLEKGFSIRKLIPNEVCSKHWWESLNANLRANARGHKKRCVRIGNEPVLCLLLAVDGDLNVRLWHNPPSDINRHKWKFNVWGKRRYFVLIVGHR